MGSLHAMNSRSQTQTLPCYNIIGYWSAINSFWCSVELILEIDFEDVNIFL